MAQLPDIYDAFYTLELTPHECDEMPRPPSDNLQLVNK